MPIGVRWEAGQSVLINWLQLWKAWVSTLCYPIIILRHTHTKEDSQTSEDMLNCCCKSRVGLIVIRADESLFYQASTTPLVSPLPFPIMPLICSGPTSSMTHFSLSNCVYSPNEPFSTSHNEFFFPFLHRQNISEHKTLGCVK